MKNYYYLFTLLFVCLLTFSCSNLKQAVGDKVSDTVSDVIDDTSEAIFSHDGKGKQGNDKGWANTNTSYDYTPGNHVVFSSNMQSATLGEMPKYWKTSGSGEVATFPGVQGKWLLFNEHTTYKLDTLFSIPVNSSVEFDIITRSINPDDLGDLTFGFAHDNSVSDYTPSGFISTTIHYWNKEIINSSNDTEKYNSIDFPLASYGDAIMHVSIMIKGTHMKVYLDRQKVLDTEMFLPSSIKRYFYISPPSDLAHNAQIGISNFVVAKY